MGLFSILFGRAMGYSISDIRYWERAFPDGVTRCEFFGGLRRQNVSILDAIRHVQNSHGWRANESCYAIFSGLKRGEMVFTRCGRYYYVHDKSAAAATQAQR